MSVNKYISNIGFIIFNDETNAIRCDNVLSFGPTKLSDDRNAEYYINNILIFRKQTYYDENINLLFKYISNKLINHLKFNIVNDLNIDNIIKEYQDKYKK